MGVWEGAFQAGHQAEFQSAGDQSLAFELGRHGAQGLSRLDGEGLFRVGGGRRCATERLQVQINAGGDRCQKEQARPGNRGALLQHRSLCSLNSH